MPSTIPPYAAFDYAKNFIGNADLERLNPRILDDVSKMFWTYAPWRWSLALMPQVTLVSNTQDYTVAVPSDFLYLYDVLQLDGKTTRHIKPSAIFPVTGVTRAGQIDSVALTGTTLRVDPTPGTIPASPVQKLYGIYKIQSPEINTATMYDAGALLIPDEWFWVFQEGVLWKAMSWAQDPRAGNTEYKSGNVAYSGQRAVFEAAMLSCANKEKLYLEDIQEAAR